MPADESDPRPVRTNTEALAAALIEELGDRERRRPLVERGVAILTDVLRQFPRARDIQIRTDGHLRVQLGGTNVVVQEFRSGPAAAPDEKLLRLRPAEAAGLVLALWRSRSGARVESGLGLVADDNRFLTRLGREKRNDFSARGDSFASGGLVVGNLRVHAFWDSTGLACTARILHDTIPELDTLGFRPDHVAVLQGAVRRSHGILLVTGKTGQGKSTTLAALAQWLLENEAQAHVLTIEDPIEYRLRDHNARNEPLPSLRTQKEVGIEVETFAQGVKFGLRESPTVIIIGEIRDRETLDAALKVAESGHLILSTLHTDSGPGTISRIASLYPESEREAVMTLLAEQLVLVLSQGLLRSSDPGRDKVLCYELMQNNALDSRTAIGGFQTKGPAPLHAWMRRESNWAWDRHLDDLHRHGFISEETLRTHRHHQPAAV